MLTVPEEEASSTPLSPGLLSLSPESCKSQEQAHPKSVAETADPAASHNGSAEVPVETVCASTSCDGAVSAEIATSSETIDHSAACPGLDVHVDADLDICPGVHVHVHADLQVSMKSDVETADHPAAIGDVSGVDGSSEQEGRGSGPAEADDGDAPSSAEPKAPPAEATKPSQAPAKTPAKAAANPSLPRPGEQTQEKAGKASAKKAAKENQTAAAKKATKTPLKAIAANPIPRLDQAPNTAAPEPPIPASEPGPAKDTKADIKATSVSASKAKMQSARPVGNSATAAPQKVTSAPKLSRAELEAQEAETHNRELKSLREKNARFAQRIAAQNAALKEQAVQPEHPDGKENTPGDVSGSLPSKSPTVQPKAKPSAPPSKVQANTTKISADPAIPAPKLSSSEKEAQEAKAHMEEMKSLREKNARNMQRMAAQRAKAKQHVQKAEENTSQLMLRADLAVSVTKDLLQPVVEPSEPRTLLGEIQLGDLERRKRSPLGGEEAAAGEKLAL